MALAATRIHDADAVHCSQPHRAECSKDVFLNGKGWSLMSHHNDGHLKPSGDKCVIHTAPITTGSPTVFVNGLGAGRITDDVLGCTFVVEGSPDVYCGPG